MAAKWTSRSSIMVGDGGEPGSPRAQPPTSGLKNMSSVRKSRAHHKSTSLGGGVDLSAMFSQQHHTHNNPPSGRQLLPVRLQSVALGVDFDRVRSAQLSQNRALIGMCVPRAYLFMYVHIYICIYMYIYMFVCVLVCVCSHVCTRLCMHRLVTTAARNNLVSNGLLVVLQLSTICAIPCAFAVFVEIMRCMARCCQTRKHMRGWTLPRRTAWPRR